MTTRWNAQEPVTLRDAIDQLFQESFVARPRAANGNRNHVWTPAVDAWEDQEQIVVQLALPGVTPENVDITFTADTVVVRGEVTAPEGNKNWVVRELPSGTFERRFSLNVPINAEKVGASAHNGILTVRLPKSEAIKPRKIEVKAQS